VFSSRSLEVAWQRMIAELEAEEEVHRSVDVTCVLYGDWVSHDSHMTCWSMTHQHHVLSYEAKYTDWIRYSILIVC